MCVISSITFGEFRNSAAKALRSVATLRMRATPRRASALETAFSTLPSVTSRGSRPVLSIAANTSGISAFLTPTSESTAVRSRRSDTRARTSREVRPTARITSIATARSSASAATDASPMMSTFSWKCSRSLPFCWRSYRNNCGTENQRIGFRIAFAFAATMRASVGVISGRRATSRSPLSVKV